MNNTAIKAIGDFARRTWDISVNGVAHGFGVSVGIGAFLAAFGWGYELGMKDKLGRSASSKVKADRVYEWDPRKDQDKDEE